MLFFRVPSPPQPTNGVRGPRETGDWEVLEQMPLNYLGVSHSKSNWQEAREDSVSLWSVKIASPGQLYPNESAHIDIFLLHWGILD